MKRFTLHLFLAIQLLIVSNSSFSDILSDGSADKIDTSDVVSNSLSPACTSWCVTGVCFWLVCTPLGCDVETNLRIRHGAASLVVNVYNHAGDPAWEDSIVLGYDGSGGGLGAGGGTDSQEISPVVSRLDTNLKYKEVGVHGNPVPFIMSQIDYFCPTDTVPYMPYYSSETDSMAWRSGLPERYFFWNMIPGFNEIGDFPWHTWSPLYPRYGFINQKDDAHAAGVAAIRGADIAHEGYLSPHLHIQIEEEAKVDSSVAAFRYAKEKPWQRLTPNPSDQCEIVGDDNSLDWSSNVKSDGGFNAWNYWHIYECCVPNKGMLISYTTTQYCAGE